MRGCYHLAVHARSVAVAVALLLSAVSIGGRQFNQDDLVKQFYPTWLADDSSADFKAGGPPPHRDVAFANADLDGTGLASYIVAAFSNGVAGAVSVLAKRGNAAVAVAAPRYPLMVGFSPTITLRDLDGDGRPEIIVSFLSAGGNRAEWVFKWNGISLTSIADEVDEHGDASAVIVDGMYIDLNGDGVLEIITPEDFDAHDTSGPLDYDVYSLVGGKYRLTRTLSFIGTFARPDSSDADTESVTKHFAVRNPATAYDMTIVNGDDDGSHRVTSADIFVNGVRVAPALSRGDGRRIVSVRLKTLAATNTIRAVLRGPRQTWLLIAISPVSPLPR